MLPVLSLLAEAALLLPVWILGVLKYRAPWSQVGFRPFAARRSLGLGCMFFLICMAFNFIWSLVLFFFQRTAQPSLIPLFGSSVGGFAMALLTVGLIAPVVEEAFFRGFIFAGLRPRLGLRRATVLSAALFAIAHLLPSSIPPIFVLGLVFASLYQQTDSIWPSILLHGFINTFSLLATYLLPLLSR